MAIKIEFHPGALEALDRHARSLIDHVGEKPADKNSPPAFETDVPITTIPNEDVHGFRAEQIDAHGNTLAHDFEAKGNVYRLNSEGCNVLRQIVTTLHKNKGLRDRVSVQFVVDTALAWLKVQIEGDPAQQTRSFSDAFIETVQKSVSRVAVWVPIANLVIQAPFNFGGSTIAPVSAAQINAWETKANSDPAGERQHVAEFFGRIRKQFQGYAAVLTIVEAEPLRAEEFAYEQAERVLAILGIYSGAVLHPNAKCPFSMRGRESIPMATLLFEREGSIENMRLRPRGDPTSALMIQWSDADVRAMGKLGLNAASRLLVEEKRASEFDTALLVSLFLYSRAAYTDEPIDKVVSALSSLESLLLKDENEAIQQNLGERLAIFLETGLQRRKALIAAVKDAYRLRSRFLHHGYSGADDRIVRVILAIAWRFYVKLLTPPVDQHPTRLAFVQSIDDAKLGG